MEITKREHDVMLLLVGGLANKQICQKLGGAAIALSGCTFFQC
jgi:DNA-binding CsgD family transcriptional regulator